MQANLPVIPNFQQLGRGCCSDQARVRDACKTSEEDEPQPVASNSQQDYLGIMGAKNVEACGYSASFHKIHPNASCEMVKALLAEKTEEHFSAQHQAGGLLQAASAV